MQPLISAAHLKRRDVGAGARLVKVLLISDSLGAPIHPRGIFNYSISLVEMLKAAHCGVDLVVEGSAEYGVEGGFGELEAKAPQAVNAARLTEIHRYFNQSRLGFLWSFKPTKMPLLAKYRPRLLRLWIALRERANYRPNVSVKNDPQALDFVPDKSRHLTLFDNLIVKHNFYSSSMSRANLGLAPPWIDASGYDLVIVDTPHFIKINGVGPDRILTILHDLIPLRDPAMESRWRHLFLRKLETTLAMGSALVFVSRYTQTSFHFAFPNHKAPREYILYPAIRRNLLSADVPLREYDIRSMFAGAAVDSGEVRGKKRKRNGALLPPGFDASLPYFVTATSDEPRKNISTLVRAFYGRLRGRANLVILGEIDARRHIPAPDANVGFPGYVSDDDKVDCFRHAQGVVFASLSEGFGIPIVEGAVLGRPVLCSDIEVFREVAGADAFYFDPRHPASIAGAVVAVLADPAAARERAAALHRSVIARFSQAAVGESLRAALADLTGGVRG